MGYSVEDVHEYMLGRHFGWVDHKVPKTPRNPEGIQKGGSGLEGHNFGNLFITALTDILGSEEKAFRKVSKILNVKGRVFPVTFDNVQLIAQYEDGSIGYGESMIDSPPSKHNEGQRITKLWVQPKAEIYVKSKEAIINGDLIVLGPGDLYTSVLANVVVDGCASYISESKAKILFIPNLVSKFGQTDNFKVSDYVSEIEKYIKRKIDYILMNQGYLPDDIVARYSEEHTYPVVDDMGKDERMIRKDLLSDILISQIKSDKVKRSLLRHDSQKIADAIQSIILK